VEEIRFSQRAKVFTVAMLVALALLLIYAAHDVIGPFLWAFIAAYVLNPLITFLVRHSRLPRPVVVALFYVLFLTLLGLGAKVLVPALEADYHQLRRSLPELASSFEAQALGGQTPTILGIQVDPHALAVELGRASDEGERWIRANAIGLGVRVLEYVVKTLLFLVATFYLLLQWDNLVRAIRNLTPSRYRAELGALAAEVNAVFGVYLRGLLFLVVLMSTVTWIALAALGLRYAVFVAIATGILELIPFAGPITAGAIAVTIGVVEGNPFGWSPLAYAGVLALVYLVLRHLEDYIVIPHVVGHAVKVHPLIILFSVVVGADIFGIGGAILAAPMVGMLRVVLGWLLHKLRAAPAPEEVAPVPVPEPKPVQPVVPPLPRPRPGEAR